MLSIYGHKWASHLGLADDGTGALTDAAKTWQKGLAGVTVEQIKHGFDVLIFKNHDWPPSLPEFRKLCLSRSAENIPSIDEVVSILVLVSSKKGSIAARYEHPLVFSISQQIDMHGLRSAKTVDAKRLVKPIYERLVNSGWDGWPDHAHEDQLAISQDKPEINRVVGKSAFSAIRSSL
jgi:hypothetical protein